ncbi:DUF6745 domain-containing protein [Actinoplanes awajinensis]|uniref:DUF6745 domain-containing protein n=1 Tax=Actinoplanes awajinensis subsp. mycoplanecinus TaxID=135947 RepID=A0A101JKG6_9ACTN|nr:hypothetical protein [Actinoplanes awajinensis]KUL28514.1 hypothetical protein ADL15_31690 [Actinoplanes awajinensis subsp. mycoplanecinus]
MKLTHEQEAMAAAVEDQWLAAAVETAPAARAEAEAGVREAYRLAGATPPERIYWFGSPRAGAAAVALLAGAPAPGPDDPAWFAEAHAELRRQGWIPGETAGRSLRRRVRTEPWAAARQAAVEALGADGWAQLSAAAGRRSWALVMDLIAGRLRLRLGEDIATEFPGETGRAVRRPVLDAIYGQHDGTWLSTFEAADRLLPEAGLTRGLTGLAQVARHTGWWWANERVAVLTERPGLLARDNVGRLHRGEGAAMEFPDGWGLWAWRGMPIPATLAAELPSLTVDRIQREDNAEIRRVMLEHYGYEGYLRDAGARQLNADETGTLWFLDLPGDEPLVMVEVINATPEPDGTSRVYWLRVPPQTRTAREGVAWTFALTAEEYHPMVQT